MGVKLRIATPAIALCAALASAQQLERAKFHAGNGAAQDRFGHALAIDGDLLLVGAPRGDDSGGSVYLFDISDPLCAMELAEFRPVDGLPGDRFGEAITIDGNTALIGAPRGEGGEPYSGIAYLIDISVPTSPRQLSKLVATGWDIGGFGTAVALSGSIAVIGAPYNTDCDYFCGDVFLWDVSDPEAPLQRARIPGRHTLGLLGASVAVTGQTAIVGEPGRYPWGGVLLLDGVTGHELSALEPFGGMNRGGFGTSLAAVGSVLAVGAPYSDELGVRSGSAALFDVTDPARPRRLSAFVPHDGESDDRFGVSLAVDAQTLLVGTGCEGFRGSAYAYEFGDPRHPVERGELQASDRGENDRLGVAVALRGDVALAAAPLDDDRGENSGAVYVYFPVPCWADLTGNGVVDGYDYLGYFALWMARDPGADWDHDGAINTLDFLAFLGDWAAGC